MTRATSLTHPAPSGVGSARTLGGRSWQHRRRRSPRASGRSRSPPTSTRGGSPSRSRRPPHPPLRPRPWPQPRSPPRARRRTDMARTIDLNVTTYWWIPGDAGIANPDAVSAAVLTAGTNISVYLHSSTSINATSSDTVSEKGITDVANVVTPIIGNYEGTLVGFRDMTAGVPLSLIHI